MFSLVLGTVRSGRLSRGGVECQEAGVECSSLKCQLANKSIRETMSIIGGACNTFSYLLLGYFYTEYYLLSVCLLVNHVFPVIFLSCGLGKSFLRLCSCLKS